MKNQEHIIILEDNDISLYVAQSMLAPIEDRYSIHYFTSTQETLEFLKELTGKPDISVNMFVNMGATLKNKEFIALARKTILSDSSRLFLLTSMPVPDDKMKEFEAIGFLCCIEKPLTEDKFIQALDNNILKNPGL